MHTAAWQKIEWEEGIILPFFINQNCCAVGDGNLM